MRGAREAFRTAPASLYHELNQLRLLVGREALVLRQSRCPRRLVAPHNHQRHTLRHSVPEGWLREGIEQCKATSPSLGAGAGKPHLAENGKVQHHAPRVHIRCTRVVLALEDLRRHDSAIDSAGAVEPAPWIPGHAARVSERPPPRNLARSGPTTTNEPVRSPDMLPLLAALAACRRDRTLWW